MALKFAKLTRDKLRSLNTGEALTEHGIKADRLASGDLRWSVNVMVDNQRIHRVIGRESDGVTRTQAEQAIETLRTKAREGRLSLPKGRKTAISFERAGADYISILREQGGKTIQRKERTLALHLNPYFGNKSLGKITSADGDLYRERRRKAGASDATINRELAVASHLYSKAVEWDWVSARPRFKKTKEDRVRLIYLTQEQCANVLHHARSDISEHIHAYCFIALSTSMRMSEILAIRIEHLDLPRRRIFVPDAKAGQREQPITAQLAAFLSKRVLEASDDVPWLFPNPKSKSGHLMTIRKAHRRVIKAAGLDPDVVVRHTFRHTAITHLVQAGIDLPTVQKISGHKTLAMVAHYAHANGAHIDSAMDRLADRITLPTSPITHKLHTA